MASVIVDDTDLSQLAYTAHSDWVREGSPPEYDSTTHGTGQAGATVTFTFNGTSVGVFGSVAQSTAAKNLTTISTYQVDGKSTVTYTAPISIMTHLTHVQFFQSATLEDGEHSLLITVVNASDARMYWLDYLVYMPGSSSPSSTSSPISTPLSSDNSGSSHSGVSGGIIAAAVLVSVSVVVMLAVVALWWRKRKTRPQERGQYEIEALAPPSSFTDQSLTTMSVVTPYMSYTPPPSYAEPEPSYTPPATVVVAPPSRSSVPVAPRREKDRV